MRRDWQTDAPGFRSAQSRLHILTGRAQRQPLRMRPRRMIAVRTRLSLACECATRVGVVRIARRIHGVGCGVDPDDPVVGAAQPGIVLGLEREEVPGPVRSGALRGGGEEETYEKCRGGKAEHVVPLCGNAGPVYT